MLYSKFLFDEDKLIDFFVNECNLVYGSEEKYPELVKKVDYSEYHLFVPNTRMISTRHTNAIVAMIRKQHSIHVVPAVYLFLHPYVHDYWNEREKQFIQFSDDVEAHKILMRIDNKEQFLEEVKHQFAMFYKKIKQMENEIRRKIIISASEEYKV